ncbi:hypothetical protein [Roseomonas mucosa]|uniref:hypothetical protein n=1 Tax=Roseomonas mucosa TaxID=207340 RepID=UPI000DB7C10E|nr:hypothetical protein [Roseomonas mucosa]PZR61509.1 MAG: hypothetical protein DI537_52495 [Stutzerimonas stutzeri]UZO94691.1 hypothetical protein RMP42_05877 [Roseomonas mucosa]
MLSKVYRTLPPSGVWLLASAAFFLVGSLLVPGSDNSHMSTLGLIGALLAVLVIVGFSGRGPHQRR